MWTASLLASLLALSPAAPHEISDLAWLAGSWKGPMGDGASWEAAYTTAEAGEILSANKEIRGGKVAMVEFERFQVVKGNVVLTPYPFGRKSTATFSLTSLDKTSRKAVFENPEHDFPKKIVYERATDDRLVIEVTGERRGKAAGFRLELKRVTP